MKITEKMYLLAKEIVSEYDKEKVVELKLSSCKNKEDVSKILEQRPKLYFSNENGDLFDSNLKPLEKKSSSFEFNTDKDLKPGDKISFSSDENGAIKAFHNSKELKKIEVIDPEFVNPKKEKKFSNEVYKCFEDCLAYFQGDLKPTEKDIYNWLSTIEKLNRLDHLQFSDIVLIVKEARSDKFWRKNFLSLVKLRRKDKDKVPYWKVFKEKFKFEESKTENTLSAYAQAKIEMKL